MTQPKIDHLEAVRQDSILPSTIDGVPCYAFNVRPGDVQAWDAGNVGSNGKPNERAEISYDVCLSNARDPQFIRERTGGSPVRDNS